MPQITRELLFGVFGLAIASAAVLVGCRRPDQPDAPKDSPASTSAGDDVRPESPRPTITGALLQAAPRELDPRADGWDSEVFVEDASATLQGIIDVVTANRTIASQHVQRLVTADCRSTSLRAEPVRLEYRQGPVSVWRGQAGEAAYSFRGPDGWARALAAFMEPTGQATDRRVQLKITQVTIRGADVETSVYVQASGRARDETIQQTAVWRCVWQYSDNASVRLAELRAEQYEEVHVRGAPWFADCTEQILAATTAYRQQLAFGLHYWLDRIGTAHGMNYFSRHGLAVGDVNGDGLDDLYLCQPGGLPNRLFIQSPDGSVSDCSAQYAVDFLDRTASALLVDLDNDGDQDLALATIMGVQLLENLDKAKFVRRQQIAFPDTDLHALSAVDYDNDGNLDLYVTVDYASARSRVAERLPPFIYHDANDGGANHLLRNDLDRQASSDWTFVDVTQDVGLHVHNQRHSLAAAWEDYDQDGDQDLYVANDYGRNCLYRNDDGYFVEVAAEAGVVDFGSGMSVSWGDYNRDGLADLYVGNMQSTAGRRITRQKQFLATVDDARRRLYQRFAKGNSLFLNAGDGTFQEVGAQANVEGAQWAWSSLLEDVNNDGWQDIVVANGYITTEDTGDL